MKPFRILTGAALIFLSASPVLRAQDGPVPRPEDVEPAPTLEDFGELLSNSPFRRLLSLSDELVLSGVAQLPTGIVVTVVNRRTNETITVSREENEYGWKLLGVTSGRDLDDITATIQVGRQEIVLRFSESRLTPRSRRRRNEAPQPASQPEKPSVEQWLARLDPKLLSTLDELAEPRKEQFKYQFKDYLERYPEASTELRLGYAQEKFEELIEKEEEERRTEEKLIEDVDVDPENP